MQIVFIIHTVTLSFPHRLILGVNAPLFVTLTAGKGHIKYFDKWIVLNG